MSKNENIKLTLSLFLVFTSLWSGLLTGCTMVFLQLTLLVSKLDADPFSNTLIYFLAVMTLISALGNFINLTKTQTMYSQLQAFPPYESSLLMGQLSAGGAIMNEFKNYTSNQLSLLFSSALIIICGILYKIWFYEGETSLEDAENVSNLPENK